MNHMYMMLTYMFMQQQHRDHFYNSSYTVIENVLIYSFYTVLIINACIVFLMTILDFIDQRKKKEQRNK